MGWLPLYRLRHRISCERPIGRLISYGEMRSVDLAAFLRVAGHDRVEDPGCQQRAFHRVDGVAGLNHGVDCLDQVDEVAEGIGLLEIELRGQGLVPPTIAD